MPGMRYSGLCVLSSLPLLAVLLDAGVTQVVVQDIATGHASAPAQTLSSSRLEQTLPSSRLEQTLPSSRLEIGEKLAPVGLLRDVRGNQRWFSEFKDYKAFAVVTPGATPPDRSGNANVETFRCLVPRQPAVNRVDHSLPKVRTVSPCHETLPANQCTKGITNAHRRESSK